MSTTLVLAHHARAALARARRQPDAPELMRRLAAIADDFNR